MADICKYDVADKEKLALFRHHLINCQDILAGKDRHSITNQILDMVWDDTVYRTYNEARRLSAKTKNPKTGLAGTLIELIDVTFTMSQIMAIRRLVDSSEWGTSKKVYSLPSLITEIERNKELYTRENYVCYDGLPYEETDLELQQERINLSRHKNYDYLSGTNQNSRTRNDIISDKIFNELKMLLGKTELIRSYSNKFIAHAAAPENRTKIEEELKALTLRYFEECYEAIIKVGKLIQVLVDKFMSADLAAPQFDQLENWEKPLVTKADKNKLYTFWRERWKYFDNLNRL
jgi:hypothetical protein